MKNKINFYKILAVVFIFAIVILSAIIYIRYSSYYDFGSIKIKQSVVDGISKDLNGRPFKICDMESNKCIVISSIG